MSDNQAFQQCVQAFVTRDYAGCAQRARAQILAGIGHELRQLLLISLQRLGQSQLAKEFGWQMLAATAGHPWVNELLRLTLGLVEPSQILDQAKTEEQRCEVFFYQDSGRGRSGGLPEGGGLQVNRVETELCA